jgi:glycosyltransferase involved in cell wall biosynthesis
MKACLLGIHPAHRFFSIDNYLEYCRQELPRYLVDWEITSLRPGNHSARVFPFKFGRVRSQVENYLSWPVRLARLEADVFHVVDQNIAWYCSFLSKGRKLLTIHDLINLLNVKGKLRLGAEPVSRQFKIKLCVRNIRKADALICVSQNTADSVIRELEIPVSRIHVVPNMISGEFVPVSFYEREVIRRARFAQNDVLLLHVGAPSPYKNRVGVLRIFTLVRKMYPNSRLMLTGARLTPKELEAVQDQSLLDAISVILPASRSELRNLYGAADVLLFPSIYEGFGWPPIEAMACGCPVITSQGGSLPEVVGDAGLQILDPHDHLGFAQAVQLLLKDSNLRSDLVAKGFRNALRFAPDSVAPRLAEVYRSLN